MGDEPQSILVVDDDAAVADAYRLLLERDYEVSVATGGNEAIQAIDETTDVLLLDRKMPETPGDEVLRWIRDNGYSCAVAFVTAAEPFEDDKQLPFDGYLTKPVDKATLRSAVARLASLDTTAVEKTVNDLPSVSWGGDVVRTNRGWETVS